MSRLESDWEASLTAGFHRNLGPVRQQFNSNQMSRCISLYPYLTGMDVREYVRLMMTEIQGHLSGSGQVTLGKATLYRRLGELAMKRWVVGGFRLGGGRVKVLAGWWGDALRRVSGCCGESGVFNFMLWGLKLWQSCCCSLCPIGFG